MLLLAAWRGWRRGLMSTIAAVAGLVLGVAVGSRVAAWLVAVGHLTTVARVLVSIVVVISVSLTVSSVAGAFGRSLHKKLTWRPAATIDNLGGSVVDLVAVAVVVWMVASVASVVPGTPSQTVNGSRIVRAIDARMPVRMDALLAQLVKTLDNSGVPRVFYSFGGVRPPVTGAVDEAIAQATPVLRASRSVVRLSGEPRGCQGTVVGSGFVFAVDRVMTNAHVVAGLSKVRVEHGGGLARIGAVVYFDPRIDVAVVKVSTQGWPTVPMADVPAESTPAAALGYPGGGALAVTPAKVADVFTARGSDIYGGGSVVRRVLALRSHIVQGDSGGALVDGAGAVRGVVFAVSLDDPSIGYALAPDTVSPAISVGRNASAPAATGVCSAKE